MSDTPRTDALLMEADDSAPFVELARQLERELTRERELVKGIAEFYGTTPEILAAAVDGAYL